MLSLDYLTSEPFNVLLKTNEGITNEGNNVKNEEFVKQQVG